MRNEESYIEACLSSLLNQSYPLDSYEVIVLDGRSSDRSAGIVRDIQRQWANVRCLDNPAGIASTAMNLGIRTARGDIVIRADAHSVYPRNYIEVSVKYLKQTGADNVGGPLITVPSENSFGAKLVSAILTNRFGVGDSHFRTSMKDGFVDTVPFGAFRKDLFDRVGLYNEKLVINEDNELNDRIRRAGGKVYLVPELATQYYPVKTFGRLLTRVFRIGLCHIFTLRQSWTALGSRHLVPALFVATVIGLCFLSLFTNLAKICLGLLMAVYLVTASCFAVANIKKHSGTLVAIMPLAFLVFHFAYGLGTLVGLKYLFTDPAPLPIRAGGPVGNA